MPLHLFDPPGSKEVMFIWKSGCLVTPPSVHTKWRRTESGFIALVFNFCQNQPKEQKETAKQQRRPLCLWKLNEVTVAISQRTGGRSDRSLSMTAGRSWYHGFSKAFISSLCQQLSLFRTAFLPSEVWVSAGRWQQLEPEYFVIFFPQYFHTLVLKTKNSSIYIRFSLKHLHTGADPGFCRHHIIRSKEPWKYWSFENIINWVCSSCR